MNREQLLNAIEALIEEIDDDAKLGRVVRRLVENNQAKPKPDPFPGDAEVVKPEPKNPFEDYVPPGSTLYGIAMPPSGTKYGTPPGKGGGFGGGGYRYGVPF